MNIKHSGSPNRLPGSINEALFSGYIQDWYMTTAERFALITLLNEIRPECAIEIGTSQGGSLSVLSQFSKKVYTLDIDKTCHERLGQKFSNVVFITGLSQETLPSLLQRLQEDKVSPGFVLIDGDHSRNGVKRDIENLLKFRPTQPLYIIMHDSFNPDCRKGIVEANWAANPYVHFVEVDFVPGQFISELNHRSYREMWCGFALAYLLPVDRKGNLEISENEKLLFHTTLRHSVHCYAGYVKWHLLHIVSSLRMRAKKLLQK